MISDPDLKEEKVTQGSVENSNLQEQSNILSYLADLKSVRGSVIGSQLTTKMKSELNLAPDIQLQPLNEEVRTPKCMPELRINNLLPGVAVSTLGP